MRLRNSVSSRTVPTTGTAAAEELPSLAPPPQFATVSCLTDDHQENDDDEETGASWLMGQSDDDNGEGYDEEDVEEYESLLYQQQEQRRILDRNSAFRQSRGQWSVQRLSRGSFASFQRRQQRRRRRRERRSSRQRDNDQTRGQNNWWSWCCCSWCCGFRTPNDGRDDHYRRRCCSCMRCSNCFWRIWNEWIKGDWFHRLAYQRTCVLVLILFCCYSAIVVFFAFVYLAVSLAGQKFEVDPDSGSITTIAFCDMEINDHMEALYFSLSTMTTIGYAVSDYYFGGCWTPFLLVLWQVCSAICFDAVAVGLLFQKISRGRKRAKTILFSDKAVIQRIGGVPHFMFRLGELRNRYHLMQATVHVYCIRHERTPVTTSPRVRASRSQYQQPSQETAAATATAAVVVTEQSPPVLQSSQPLPSQSLPPPPLPQPLPNTSTSDIQTTHFITRQVKLLHPNEAFGSHILMSLPQVVVHRMDSASPLIPPRPVWYNVEGVPQYSSTLITDFPTEEVTPSTVPSSESYANELRSIEQFLWDRDVEIIVLVEGTDEGTGAPTQARHSYKLADLAFNYTFTPCVSPTNDYTNTGLSPNREMSDGDGDGERGQSWSHGGSSTGLGRRLLPPAPGEQRRVPRRQWRNNRPVLTIDFQRFHDIEPAPENSVASPYVPDTNGSGA